METKNIIAAISLSAAVIILYSLFFAPSQDELNKIRAEKEKDKIVKNSEAPSLDNEKIYLQLVEMMQYKKIKE